MDWLQTLFGAFAGTLLGAIASYRLWLIQRAREASDRRGRLLRRLRQELEFVGHEPFPPYAPTTALYADPIRIVTLTFAMDPVTEADESLLEAATNASMKIQKFNDLAILYNGLAPSRASEESRKELHSLLRECHGEVLTAVRVVVPLLKEGEGAHPRSLRERLLGFLIR